ncbi:MAG: cobalamin-dependent protein, partial [Planctomycetes bacterium]|nr:cobalamin-dependent protein [Planctomycetota bacterium]
MENLSHITEPKHKRTILLILPDAKIHKLSFRSFSRSMREAPLTLTMLSALAPEELDISFTLIDESIDTVPTTTSADMVGISVLTGTSHRAYHWADHFRKQGKTVVLGGVHVSILPDEAKEHADSILIGNGESSWPQLLRDFYKEELKQRYITENQGSKKSLSLPTPHREFQRNSGYMMPNTVMATRGCKGSCDFCTIPVVTESYLKRPIGDVIAEIKNIPGKYIAFNDVSLVDDTEYATELFKALIPLRKKWGGLATTRLLKEPQLVDVMAKSGCKFLLVGFESFMQGALNSINKGFNHHDQYRNFMSLMH